MKQQIDFRALRLKKGFNLEEIANSIKGLSLTRLCKFEDNPKIGKIKATELLLIIKLLNLNAQETKEFIRWLEAQYKLA